MTTRFSSLTQAQLNAEIERPNAFYRNCLGYLPTMFRPPYGELTPSQVTRIAGNGYTIIQWNVETNDHLVL